MIPVELQQINKDFFAANASQYDLTHADGCGQYMEAWVAHVRSLGYDKVGHLKKYGTATQYNGHAVDAFLYNEPVEPSGLLQSVDVIGNAESPNAVAGWSPDEPRYQAKDWMAEPAEGGGENDNLVPWVPYDENSFQELKRTLAYDYARRPQGADFDVSVWAARTFHNAYMGPEGKPLGMEAGMERARNEWCAALGVPVIPVPPDWNIGDIV